MELKQKQVLKRQLLLVAITSLGVYIGFAYFIPILFPFLISYLIVRLILPIVRFLKDKCHIPVIIGSILALLVTVGVLFALLFYIGTILITQLQVFLKNMPIYMQVIGTNLCILCKYVDQMFGLEEGCSNSYLCENMQSLWGYVREVGIPMISQHTMSLCCAVFGFFALFFIIIIAVVNLVVDYDSICDTVKKSTLYQVISPVTTKLGAVGIAYLKTQLIIMTINSIILVTGFHFIGSPFAWLAGIGIAVMDAFPVLGSGLFLVPLAIVRLLGGEYMHAAVILTLYAACELIRSLIEPKLLGNRIGIKPIFTLMAMYIGLELFGVAGFLLGPLALVIIKTILQETHCFHGTSEE